MSCLSFWLDLVTAVGTLGATITAVYLAVSERRQRLDCAFIWATATKDKPTLIVNNVGSRTVVLEGVDIKCNRKEIAHYDLLRNGDYTGSAIVSPLKEVQIALNPDQIHLSLNLKNPDAICRVTVVVKTTTGKKYKCRFKYRAEEFHNLFFTSVIEHFWYQ